MAEAVKHNPDLKKIIILTEKVSASDARIIRAICQTNGIDVFGGNCLGVADAWNQVRIGGALGGNKRDRVNQLWEIVQRYGYTDWDCVDENANPSRWLKVADYEQIVAELQAMRGALRTCTRLPMRSTGC